ncbi:ABC transporter substrate-binding protein [Streptomyces oryzae]|uniref:ABC transporter substrate-binding protein n=1 Tax=Streptomyces oryzae TaxID=1434886 RepID=A0ABS3XAP1_9ACTN|nr:ABC transporter substrate-binding protein [Streptomyces oryzae]MBO8192452.1 ABC transporter substrate-binding protein [Streptomyces oryzae]
MEKRQQTTNSPASGAAPEPTTSGQAPSRRTALHLIGVGGVMLTAPGLLSGCAPGGSRGDKHGDPKAGAKGTDKPIAKLNWAVDSPPRSLDFNHAFDGYSWVVYSELAEPLITCDSSGKLIPKLATSWAQPDPSTIVFTLRTGVKFWDGKTLTAEDVVWSLNRAGDPKVASEFAVNWQNVKSVHASTSGKITVRLKKPDKTFLYVLRYPPIYQKAHALAAGADFGGPSGLVMGTGPYQIKKFSSATGATMRRFDGYWGRKPTVESINVKVISDPDTLRLAVESGEVDGTFSVPENNRAAWDKMSGARVLYGPSGQVDMLILDTTRPPFDDVHARRAIAYALDRPGIIKTIEHGHADPAYSVSSPFNWQKTDSAAAVKKFFGTLPEFPLDLKRAKSELAKSATPDGFSITVLVPSQGFNSNNLILQTLQENVKDLGVHIKIKEVPFATYAGRVRGKSHDPMSIAGLGPLSPDPLSLVGSLVTGEDAGFTAYAPKDVLADLAEYKAATSAQQSKIARRVVRQLSADLPVIPITYGNVSFALNKKYVFATDMTGNTLFGDSWVQFVKLAR